jgi:hypothetical protein
MTPAQIQQVLDSLGKVGGAGWALVVRQQYVIAIQELVACLVLALFAAAALRIALRVRARMRAEHIDMDLYDNPGLTFAVGVGWVVAIGCCIAIPFMVSDAIGHLINPGGYAIYGLVPGNNG